MTDVRNDTIQVDDYEVWSSTETADEMVETHKPKSDDGGAPRKIGKDGKSVDPKPKAEKADVSKAASDLGKLGGKAAAEKRAAEKKAKAEEPEADDEKETPKEAAEEKPEPEPKKEAAEEPEETPEPEAEKPAKPRHDMQARLRQLAAARQAEADRAQRAETQLREMQERIAAIERGERRPEPAADQRHAAQPTGEQGDDPKPNADEYPTHEEYLDARDAWNERRWTRKMNQEAEQRQAAHNYAQRYADSIRSQVEAHHQRVKAALEADPTLRERVDPRLAYPPTDALENGQEPGPFNYFANEVVRSERGIEVMAHMSENPDLVAAMFRDAKEAFALGHDVESCHANAQREIQRHFLRAELSLDRPAGPRPVQPKPAPSNAKPPLKPVPTSAVVSDEERAYSDTTDYDEHVSIWNARDKGGRRR